MQDLSHKVQQKMERFQNLFMALSVKYSRSSLMIETFGWKLKDNLVMAVYLLLRKMPSNRNW